MTPREKFLLSKGLKLTVLSYLPGYTLFHKIALLNKETRLKLPECKLLDQKKNITLKKFAHNFEYSNPLPPLENLTYALKLADEFTLQVD